LHLQRDHAFDQPRDFGVGLALRVKLRRCGRNLLGLDL
jgi:hypothetical protein